MDKTADTVRLPGGETVPRRLEHKGRTTLRPEDRPPVNVDGWEILDDHGGVTELHITLRTEPGEPGLTMKELGEIDLSVLHLNRVQWEVWNRRAAIRTEDFEMLAATGRSFDDLSKERLDQAAKAAKSTVKRLRSGSTVTPEQLTEVLDAFEANGIGAVTKLGYSRSHGYKLVARAREELGR